MVKLVLVTLVNLTVEALYFM